MDVYKALRELHEEKTRLDSAILALESRLKSLSNPARPKLGRRGRRSMSEEERREVSQRMSRYWASRRALKQGGHAAGHVSAMAEANSRRIQEVA